MVGDIDTGNTIQNPQSGIAGSTSQGSFDFKIPQMGGGGGGEAPQPEPQPQEQQAAGMIMLLNMYQVPESNQVMLI